MIGKFVCKRQHLGVLSRRGPLFWRGVLVLLGGFFLPAPALAQIDIVEEIDCLALNIYFEARGEPDLGKIAVGHVVLNRVADKRFPETVCDVIRQGGEKVLNRCQFSWWCDGRSDQPREARSWQKVRTVARNIYWGFSEDPTAGALWYHADSVAPYWSRVLARGPKIGQHLFYLDADAPPRQTASLPSQ